ncbi:Cof-type HAD-IIB family hydrolase [Salinicola halophilus]|uniref:Cof-type HAD-IIB family hydrolase n=1 Tax=Salinicola halophilus TaxID=184065 RepID=UPI000DA143EF|nr:Cof-type HAD-IIB family hydrolase [Salinicola halophilus]
MRQHLIVSDLDSTLLDGEHRIDDLTRDTLRELSAQGHVIALASGRHYRDIATFRRLLDIPAWLISSNGAYVHDPEDNVVGEALVPAARAEALTQLPRPDDVRLNLYTRDRWLIDAEAPALLKLHQTTGFTYEVTDLAAAAVDEPVGKVLYIGEPAALSPIERTLRERFEASLHVTYSAADSLEIMGQGVNKASALERVLAALDMDPSQTLAFGDNFNDVEMLTLAGHAFVVDNAHPEVVERLPRATRIGSHREAGVARRLRAFFRLD